MYFCVWQNQSLNGLFSGLPVCKLQVTLKHQGAKMWRSLWTNTRWALGLYKLTQQTHTLGFSLCRSNLPLISLTSEAFAPTVAQSLYGPLTCLNAFPASLWWQSKVICVHLQPEGLRAKQGKIRPHITNISPEKHPTKQPVANCLATFYHIEQIHNHNCTTLGLEIPSTTDAVRGRFNFTS